MKLTTVLSVFAVVHTQDTPPGLEFDKIWPFLMKQAQIPKNCLFWPYLLGGQKMSPLLFYEMVKDNIKGTDLEKNFLPLAGLLGIGSDDGANANSMAYGLIPLFFNNNFQSTDFNQLFTNPGFMNMLNTPVNNEPYLDPFSQQWVAPGQFNQQNGLFTMLMMQLIRQKDPAVDNMLNMVTATENTAAAAPDVSNENTATLPETSEGKSGGLNTRFRPK